MSPEQARGREVDRRADVWAFGSVMYEMLTGRRAFDGETISDTLASVLKIDPDWDALPEETPPAVRRLLRRCLTRDADARLSHISGVRLPLRETLDGEVEAETSIATPEPTSPASWWLRMLPWALVLLMTVVAAGALVKIATTGKTTTQTDMLTLFAPFPEGHVVPNDQMGVLALSPDGKNIAMVLEKDGIKHLYSRRMNSSTFVRLPGTESASTPFFSPDGQWIAFISNDKLMKVSVDGGNPMTLAVSDGNNRGASWGAGDRIVFAPHYTTGLMQVAGGGGEPTPLTTLDSGRGERSHRWPHAVPGEDVVLFTVGAMDSPESYDQSNIDAVRPSSGERRTVLRGASMARYVPTGHLMFAREGFLFAVRFDIKTLETLGSPVPVVETVMGMRSSGVAHAAVADSGLLAYVSGTPQSRESRLVWKHRDGKSEPLPSAVAGYVGPTLSPDRKQIAVAIEGESTFDIWIYDIERDTMTRLTFEGDNNWPIWSPDGEYVSFSSVRDGSLMSAYRKAADGSGSPEQIFSPEGKPGWGQVSPVDWSPDGRYLLMDFTNENGVNVLAFAPDEGKELIVMETPATEQSPTLSPDGRWLSYASDETGAAEAYVRPFPERGGKWQISTDGGAHPRWSPDGRKIFFRQQGSLMEVDVDVRGDSFQASRPRLVLDGLPSLTTDPDYEVLDSDTFLVVELAGDDTAPQAATVVVNWLDELRRRVP
jgi:serine/threonine-protein kinase